MKCKTCGSIVDKGLVACPKCGADPNALPAQVLSREQTKVFVKQVRRQLIMDSLWWVGLLSLIFGFSLLQIYLKTITALQTQLVRGISDEFKEPRIRATVQSVATEQAMQILREQVEPVVTDFKAEVGFKLADSEALIASTRASLDDLTTLIALEDSAGFGDRKSYEKLSEIAQGKGPIAESASRRVVLIKRDLSVYRQFPGAYSGVEVTRAGKQVNVNQLETDELLELLSSGTLSREMVPAALYALDTKPKDELCRRAAQLFAKSNSLPACAAFCGILERKLGPKAEFLAFTDWSRICERELVPR